MRKALVVFLILVLLAAVLFALSPFGALRKMHKALLARDPQAMSAVVDFEAVRANAERRVQGRIAQDNSAKPLSGIRDAMADRLADRVIEKIETPEGFIALVCDHNPRAEPQPPGTPCQLQKGKIHDVHFDGSARFSAGLRRDDGMDITVVMQRDGLHWRIVDLVLPPAEFERIRDKALGG